MPKVSKLGIPFPSRTPEYQREWRKLNKHKEKEYYKRYKTKSQQAARRRRYGLSPERYEFLLETQEHSCAICYTKAPGRGHTVFHVDHCHTSGKVRGLLCDKCNRGLGYFDDNPDNLIKAAEYLNENN